MLLSHGPVMILNNELRSADAFGGVVVLVKD